MEYGNAFRTWIVDFVIFPFSGGFGELRAIVIIVILLDVGFGSGTIKSIMRNSKAGLRRGQV